MLRSATYLFALLSLAVLLAGCGSDESDAKADGTTKSAAKKEDKKPAKLGPLPAAADPTALLAYATTVKDDYPDLWETLTDEAASGYSDLEALADADGKIAATDGEGAATPAYYLHTGLQPIAEQSKAGFELIETGPGKVAVEQYRYQAAGQVGRTWDLLLPAHQTVAPKDKYVSCTQNGAGGANLNGVVVKEVYDEDYTAPGTKLRKSKAVTVQLYTDMGDAPTTSHYYEVGGEWKWILSQDYYDAFKRGECPL